LGPTARFDVSRSAAWTRVPPGDGISPCIKTNALRLLWWFQRRGRVFTSRVTLKDVRLLQGIPDTFVQTASDTHTAKQFGNAMSVPVLQLILANILKVLENN
jgi:site-specific DNA-cytosine methylase